MELENLEGAKFLCLGRPVSPEQDENELLITMRGLGFQTVRAALSRVKYSNRELVMRGPEPQGFQDDGKPMEETVMEAQNILNWLGFWAGEKDGILNPITKGAVRTFQYMVGLPHTGELDARTMWLLRVCVFHLGDRPVKMMVLKFP
jgi:hypothetical protein